nr:hypothetical protein JKL49_16550 [Phenylobacterium glaciei]
MESVYREAEHLCEAIITGLEREGFKPSFAEEQSRAEYSSSGYAYNYELSAVYRNQRNPAHLLLGFDFYRSGPLSEWAPGSTAVLVVGYAPRAADPWLIDELVFDTRGQLRGPTYSNDLKEVSGSGCRLLGFDEEEGKLPMAKRSWLFAVPLSRLSGPPAVLRSVVAPFTALLRREGTDFAPLRSSDAVEWP